MMLFCAKLSVLYSEVVLLWEGPLSEVSLYTCISYVQYMYIHVHVRVYVNVCGNTVKSSGTLCG